VHIVVPLPLSNVESDENIARKDLHGAVEAAIEHDVVVAGVMANPAALNLEEADAVENAGRRATADQNHFFCWRRDSRAEGIRVYTYLIFFLFLIRNRPRFDRNRDNNNLICLGFITKT